MEIKIEQIIARSFAGEATYEDQLALRQWLNASQSNKEEFQKINLAFQLISPKEEKAHQSEVYAHLVKRIESDSHRSDKKNRNSRSIKYWSSIAAAIVFLFSVSVVFYQITKPDRIQKQKTEALIVKSNPAGQKLKVFLPDGSIVWLNSASDLSYEKEFDDSTRNLYLKGEAYFEVIKDAKRPFVVHTGDLATTAIGTSFNIEAFDTNKITVSLTSGSVNVESNIPNKEPVSIRLSPGEGVLFDVNATQEIKKIPIDINGVRLWKDGILKLSDASLKETVTVLERWYGVKIEIIHSSSRHWKVNGVFDNEYLENVLNSLSFSQGFEYSMTGNNVQIAFK